MGLKTLPFFIKERSKYFEGVIKPLIVMMENAVLSAVKHLDTDLYDKYVIVSGVGNNGGDGLGIARQLKAKNKEVKVFLIGNMEKITQCSKTNLQILQAMKVEYEVICNNEDDNK